MKTTLSAETLAHLQSLCARLVESKPNLRHQVSRAYDLLVSGGIWPCAFFDDGAVALSSNGVTEYMVGPGFCECPAGEVGRLCYHRLARRMMWVASAEEAREETQRLVAAKRGRLTKKSSQSAQLGARTRALHDQNAQRLASLPLASVSPIRRGR